MSNYLHILKDSKKQLIFLGFILLIISILSLLDIHMRAVVIDTIVHSNNLNHVLYFVLIAIFVNLFSLTIETLYSQKKGKLEKKSIYNFKRFILDEIQKKDIEHFKKLNSSYLSKRIEDDVVEYLSFFFNNYSNFLIKLIELIIITIILFNIHFLIGLISLIFTPFFYIFNNFFKKPIRDRNSNFKEQKAIFFGDYTTKLENMESIIINSEIEKEKLFLKEKFIMFLYAFKKDLKIRLSFDFFKSQLNGILTFSVIAVGAHAFLNETVTIGLILASQFYIQRNQANFNYFMDLSKQYQLVKASVNRLDEISNIEKIIEGKDKILGVQNIKAKISYSFDDVSLLKEKELYASKGEVICITGKNGSGKSTLMKIIIGIIKPKETDNFKIIINNEKEIKYINTLNFRLNNLSYIPQNINSRNFKVKEIFKEFENSERLIKKLESLNIPIYDDIEKILVDKWEELILELSGGEKQILYIISGAIKNKDIFILDEPTSNLDISKIKWFRNFIEAIKKDKIIFIINHESQLNDIFDVVVKL